LSIYIETKIRELEERVLKLESSDRLVEDFKEQFQRLFNEIQGIKMRMGRNDGKRTP